MSKKINITLFLFYRGVFSIFKKIFSFMFHIRFYSFVLFFITILFTGSIGCKNQGAYKKQRIKIEEFKKHLTFLARDYLKSQKINNQVLDEINNKKPSLITFNNFYAKKRIYMVIWELKHYNNKILIVYNNVIPKQNSISKRQFIPYKYIIKEKDYYIHPKENLRDN